MSGGRKTALDRRADRALDRQLAYQQAKADRLKGQEAAKVATMMERSRRARERLERKYVVVAESAVLEVGSGANGLIFYFGGKENVGVDPLADQYRALFPLWQARAQTIAAFGESLPFDSGRFDIVLCDNVVDHAKDPAGICRELARVLKPGGLLYFTVNFHHPFYHLASSVHAGWRALGLPFEITPFADHTVHLTRRAASNLFAGLPLERLEEADNLAAVKRNPGGARARHAGDRLKRLFFKNATLEIVARRTD